MKGLFATLMEDVEASASEWKSEHVFASEEEAYEHIRKIFTLNPGDTVHYEDSDGETASGIFLGPEGNGSARFIVLHWDKEDGGILSAHLSPGAFRFPE